MEIMTREALYELVWSEPVKDLAAKLGISDVGLAKQCRHANVPVPPRGYWAKLDAGQPVERTPLPPEAPTKTGVVGVGMSDARWSNHLQEKQVEDLESFEARVRKQVRRVAVTALTGKKHPLIGELLERDERPRGYGLGFWPRFDSRLDRRRLRLLNTLFFAFERCDAKPEIRDERAYEVAIRVGATSVPLRLAPTQRSDDPLRLSLHVARPHRVGPDFGAWNERRTKLDGQLTEVVVTVLVAAEVLRREAAVAAHKAEPARQAQEAEEERRRRARAERERVERLVEEAAAHRRAEDVRAFVAAARSARVVPPTGDSRSLGEWAAWALAAADRIDPLVQQRPGQKSSARQLRHTG